MKKLITFLMTVVLTAGCVRQYDKNVYMLETRRPSEKTDKRINKILQIQNFQVTPPFDSQSLVYRKSANEYEQDFYNRFIISPSEMITQNIKSWVTNAGIFKEVINPESFLTPDLYLSGSVESMYADFRNPDSPLAQTVIKFVIFKITDTEENLLMSEHYTETTEIPQRKVPAILAAYEQNLKNILKKFEKDILINL